MSEQVIHQFIAAINAHSLEGLGKTMSADHTFVDSHENRLTGKEKTLTGWQLYFEMFPDYKIEVGRIFSDGNEFALFGFAEGTFHNLKDAGDKAHWRLPASWKAVVEDDKVALWQVYADTKIPFEIINRNAAPAGEADKVTGLGGVFFKSADPKALCKWYDEHLGTRFEGNGYKAFAWRRHENKEHFGSTAFSPFKSTTDYFAPSTKDFMFNLRVNNLDAILERLRKEGVHVFDKTDSYDFGKFGWILDLEGNKVELWEPMNED
jgi:predicted enzyme related to lactoylglutathione lyase/ketosteroid isomerase-like protein